MKEQKNFQEDRSLAKSRSSKLAAFTMEKSRSRAEGISVMERENQQLPLYKKFWFWVLVVVALLIGIGVGIFFVVTASQKGHTTAHYENDVNLNVTKLRVASVQAFSDNNAQNNGLQRSVQSTSTTSKTPKEKKSESQVASESKPTKKNIRAIKTQQKTTQSQPNIPKTSPQKTTQEKAPATEPSKQSTQFSDKNALKPKQKATKTTENTQTTKPEPNQPIQSTYPNALSNSQTHPQINTLPSPQFSNTLPKQSTNKSSTETSQFFPQSFTITEEAVILDLNSQVKK